MATLVGEKNKLRDVIEMIGAEVRMQQQGIGSLVPFIVGDPGIGKSALLKKLARDMNLDCLIVSMGAQPMEWFSGLPEFGKMKIDAKLHILGQTEVATTEWTMSDLVGIINRAAIQSLEETAGTDAEGNPTKIAAREGVMIILDDFHLIEPSIQKYMFEFLQNRTLQNFKLHPNAYLVGAMNGDSSAGLEDFNAAVLNRMAFYFASFDQEYWYDQIGHTLHPYIASFVRGGANSNYLLGATSTEGQSSSPRTMTELSHALYFHVNEGEDRHKMNHRLKMLADSRIGKSARDAWMAHVVLFQNFDFESILKKADENYRIPSDTSDQIMMAFIVRYVRTKKDAEYMKVLLDKNSDRMNFVSLFITEVTSILRNTGDISSKETRGAYAHLSKILVKDNDNKELLDTLTRAFMDFNQM